MRKKTNKRLRKPPTIKPIRRWGLGSLGFILIVAAFAWLVLADQLRWNTHSWWYILGIVVLTFGAFFGQFFMSAGVSGRWDSLGDDRAVTSMFLYTMMNGIW